VTLRGHEKDAQSIKFARDGNKNTFITCTARGFTSRSHN